MAMIEVNWNPGRRDLRVFGIAALVLTVILAALLHYQKGLAVGWALAIAGLGLVTFVLAFTLPAAARVVYVVLMAITLPIGTAMTIVLMAVFYYGIIAPLGLAFRATGRDLLDLKFTRKPDSYWVPRRPPASLKRYFHQF